MVSKPEACRQCIGSKWGMSGFVPADGEGPTLIVAEAAGKDEAEMGRPLVGKSGHTLFQQLSRVGVERDQFTIHNVLSCRPPDNKLSGMPYERDVIATCAPNLDYTIELTRQRAKDAGKQFVIITLGVVPFKRIMGLDPYRSKDDKEQLKLDYYAYPFWSDRYSCWVFNAPHPAYLVRGKTHLWPVVQFVVGRALEVADSGLQLAEPSYDLDPPSAGFDVWVEGYLRALNEDPDCLLSYDIETPYKKKNKDEEELGKEEDADHTILRCAFSYGVDKGDEFRTYTTSVRWSAEYMAGIERLFRSAKYTLGWNSVNYDRPRVVKHVQMNSIEIDGMIAWHVLNTSLPKSLGFVTPYYVRDTLMWKHMSDAMPAYYNAKDAHMALLNYVGIKRDLLKNRLWGVFENHVIKINEALKFMTGVGVLRDDAMRQEAEDKLQAELDSIEGQMQAAVPKEARKWKIAKKVPKDHLCTACKGLGKGVYSEPSGEIEGDCPVCSGTGRNPQTGWEEFLQPEPMKYCASCGISLQRKWKKHTELCSGSDIASLDMPVLRWRKPLDFKVSKVGLTKYQSILMHQAIRTRKEGKVTFNEDAIVKLMRKYPKDRLYPTILEHRKTQKLLSTYIGVTIDGKIRGGMETGRDGRIHTTYSHNPSTLRFASEEPNLQNLPRPNPDDPNDPVNIIRNLVMAAPGSVLYARDFSGIEAVLTGYFAMDPSYIRLAKRDIHTYYTVHAIYELEGGNRIQAADLPDIGWSDDRLFPYLEELKKRFKRDRNSLYKHLVHAANFMQSPKGAKEKIFSETRIEYPVGTVAKVMDVYYGLFPKIRQWHVAVLAEADKEGYLRNPYDYVHRFSKVYDWFKEDGEWKHKPGPDANRVIAFKPQSTAAGIIKEAMLRLYQDRFDEAGRFMRLQVHDELLFEVIRELWERVNLVVKEEMERPIEQMPCPDSWGMGPYLQVLTEPKVDLNEVSRWGSMKGIKD